MLINTVFGGWYNEYFGFKACFKPLNQYNQPIKENKKMKKFIFKNDLTIEIIKHNNHIIIKDENYNKITFIDYTIKQAINQFNKTYK